MSRQKQMANRLRRVEAAKRQLNVSAPMGSLANDSLPRRSERRRIGSHYTPYWLVRKVAAKAIEPLLLWIDQNPEEFDRLHPLCEDTRSAEEKAAGAEKRRQGARLRELLEPAPEILGPLVKERLRVLVPQHMETISVMSPAARKIHRQRALLQNMGGGAFAAYGAADTEHLVDGLDRKERDAFEAGLDACARCLAHLTLDSSDGIDWCGLRFAPAPAPGEKGEG